MQNNKRNKQAGFTLLEVMVVIVILGIMASMVVPNLMGAAGQAKTQKAVSDIGQMEQILDQYKLDNNRYPTTEQGLDALVNEPSVDPEPRRYRQGGYMKRIEQDPWGYDYQYVSPGENGDFDLYSLGADGEEGGEGENADIGNWNIDEFK